MAFPEQPLGLRGELMLGGSWVNITKDIYTREPIRITHGTANEGAQPDPASCALLLNNAGGRYSPRNPLGEHFGRLLRNTPIRVTVPAEESWLRLDGGHVSTPHSAALATPGDLDLRAEITPDDWVVYGRVWPVISRWEGANIGFRLSVLLRGELELAWSPTGTSAGLRAAVSTASVDGRGGRLCVRAVLDVDNGASGCTATFYTGPTMAGPWTVLGAPVVSAGTTSVANPPTPLVLGTMLGLPYPGIAMAGRLHRAEVRSGIGGAVLAGPDFTGLADGAAGVTDAAGRVWSLTGAASISRREPLFVGEVADWPARWTGSGEDAYVPVQAAGILRRLGQGRRPLESTLRRRIPGAPGLQAYWPMEDAEGATTLYSPTPGARPLRVSGMAMAADDTLPGSAPLPTLDAVASMSATVPAAPAPGWHVEMVYHLPTLPVVLTEILRVNIAGSAVRSAHVFASTTGIRIEARNADGEGVAGFTFTTPAAITDFGGVWNRLAVYVADMGGGQTRLTAAWRDITTGGRWRASTVYSGAMGTAAAVVGNWGGGTQGLALGHLSTFSVPGTLDSVGAVPGVTIYDGADGGYGRESAVDRIRRLAVEEPLLRLSARDGDIGTPAELMGPQGRAELLTLLGEVVDTDAGILAETMDRLGLVYRDRATLYNQSPALVLDYAAGQVAPPLEPAEDDAERPNDVTVTRSGGSSARVVVEEGPNSARPPEEGGIGAYEEAVTLSLGSDDQARPIAGWRAHLGTWDEARYPTVRVELHRRPELIPAALRLRVGDLIRITNPPMYTGPGPLDLIVRRIEHEPRPRAWVLTLGCTPAGPYSIGVVGDTVRGRVDTAGSVLAGSVAATDTVLPVAVTVGRPWVTAAPNVLADPHFDRGTGTWACTRGASIGAVTWERSIVHSGTGALRVTRAHPTDTGTMNLWDPSGWVPAAAGQTWEGSAWVYSGGAATNSMRVAVVWQTAAGVETFVYGTAVPTGPGVWTRLTVSTVLPAGAVRVRLGVEGRSTWTVGEWWIADDVRLARIDTLDGPEADWSAEFPFDVAIGGEVVTVHSIGSASAPTVADTFGRAAPVPLVADAFGRAVTDGWGATDTGQSWARSGGTAADYAVNGSVGTVSVGVVNSSRFTQLPSLALADVDMQADVTVPVVASGASISTGLRLRAADTSTYYYVEVVRATSGDISLLLVSRVGGSSTTIAGPVPRGAYTAGQTWTVRARLVGTVLQAKLWPTAGAEPAGWDVQTVTTSIPAAGPVGTRTILSGGNSNALPVVVSWDNVPVTPVGSGWGVSTSGHAWTRSGGTDTEYTLDGGRGLIALTSVNSSRRMIVGPALTDTDIRSAMTVPVIAETDSIDMAVMSRHQDSGTYYLAVLHCHNDSTVDVRIRKVVAGVYTTMSISALLPGTYAPGDTYWVRFQTIGSELRARGWKDGAAEPATWHATTTDSSITAAGQTGIRVNLQENSTNRLPVVIGVREYAVAGPQPFRVTRAVNGISKPHPVGTDVRLAHPTIIAL
ncbi:hypothetical protein [Streptomyces anulatus]|uniref:hypothetical protein n=1 Tax=Streptomyces anulatus TaxID=1892 RepID=UPI00386AFB74